MSSAGSSKELQLLQGIDCRCALLQQHFVELDSGWTVPGCVGKHYTHVIGVLWDMGFPLRSAQGVA